MKHTPLNIHDQYPVELVRCIFRGLSKGLEDRSDFFEKEYENVFEQQSALLASGNTELIQDYVQHYLQEADLHPYTKHWGWYLLKNTGIQAYLARSKDMRLFLTSYKKSIEEALFIPTSSGTPQSLSWNQTLRLWSFQQLLTSLEKELQTQKNTSAQIADMLMVFLVLYECEKIGIRTTEELGLQQWMGESQIDILLHRFEREYGQLQGYDSHRIHQTHKLIQSEMEKEPHLDPIVSDAASSIHMDTQKIVGNILGIQVDNTIIEHPLSLDPRK